MTVGELIAKLSKFDADANVYIEDADTQWLFGKFNVTAGDLARGDAARARPGAAVMWADSYADREE